MFMFTKKKGKEAKEKEGTIVEPCERKRASERKERKEKKRRHTLLGVPLPFFYKVVNMRMACCLMDCLFFNAQCVI